MRLEVAFLNCVGRVRNDLMAVQGGLCVCSVGVCPRRIWRRENCSQVLGEVSRTVGNHATNPFLLEDLFDTTTHKHHNNWPLVRIVLWASLGVESGQEMEDWPSMCIFSFLIHLDFESVLCREVELYSISYYKNAATSSWIHCEQVAPS
jgi:hypothetical protein